MLTTHSCTVDVLKHNIKLLCLSLTYICVKVSIYIEVMIPFVTFQSLRAGNSHGLAIMFSGSLSIRLSVTFF